MKIAVDYPCTGHMTQHRTMTEAMAEFNAAACECEVRNRAGDVVAEKYHVEVDGEIILDTILHVEDAEYVTL